MRKLTRTGGNPREQAKSRLARMRHAGGLIAACAMVLGAATAYGQSNGGSDLPGLSSLANLDPQAQSRMVSPENPTGEKGKGAMAVPDPSYPFYKPASKLGQGWKVHPFLRLEAHSTVTIMDVDGPGTIEHIWMATGLNFWGNGRATVLRFYWDDESSPSVEVPITDFFAIGNDRWAPVNSAVVIDNPQAAMNCYWPMPFRKHARITVTNDSDKAIPLFTYQIDYRLASVPENAGYFHAQWRRTQVNRSNPVYTILDGVHGEGRYVGTFLAWTQLMTGWFGEGEVKFYIDGDTKFPTIVGTGTEDYFGGDYDFPLLYSNLYTGNVLDPKSVSPDGGPPQHSLYRWHIMDPIEFHKDLKVTIQNLGWYPDGTYQPGADDIASTAFWYQKEPHAPFPKFPPLAQRWPR